MSKESELGGESGTLVVPAGDVAPLLHTDMDASPQQGPPGCTCTLRKHNTCKIECEMQTQSALQGGSELWQAYE